MEVEDSGDDEDQGSSEKDLVKRKISFDEVSDTQNEEDKGESGTRSAHNEEVNVEESPVENPAENSEPLKTSSETTTTTTSLTHVTPPKKKTSSRKSIAKSYSFLTRLFVNNVNKQIRNDVNQTNSSVLDLNVFLGQGT